MGTILIITEKKGALARRKKERSPKKAECNPGPDEGTKNPFGFIKRSREREGGEKMKKTMQDEIKR